MRTAALFFSACFLLASCTATAQSPVLQAPPPLDAAFRSHLEFAIAGIESEIGDLIDQHPELFPAHPELAWRQGLAQFPFAAYNDAARALADHRIRATLAVPNGAERSLLSDDDLRAAVESWESQLQANATQLLAAKNATAPAPGPALEEYLLTRLPAYRVVAHHGTLAAFVIGLPNKGAGANFPLVLEEITDVEMHRVAWLHPLTSTADDTNSSQALTLKQVSAIRQNVTFGPTQAMGVAYDGNRLAQEALHTRNAVSALAFTVVAEEAHAASVASFQSTSSGADLMPRLAREYAALAAIEPSQMTATALEAAYRLLASPSAGNVSAAPDDLADALGQIAGVRLLRGESALPSYPTELPQGLQSSLPAQDIAAIGFAPLIMALVLVSLSVSIRKEKND